MKAQARIYHYEIDTEGSLWIDGTQQTDPTVLKFFLSRMEKLDHGKFQVKCMGEINLIEAQDTPYVVQRIEILSDDIKLIFPGNYVQTLDPSTLSVGKNHVLYCKIREGQFHARFNRQPYMELAHWIDGNEKEGFCLNWHGKSYPIREP